MPPSESVRSDIPEVGVVGCLVEELLAIKRQQSRLIVVLRVDRGIEPNNPTRGIDASVELIVLRPDQADVEKSDGIEEIASEEPEGHRVTRPLLRSGAESRVADAEFVSGEGLHELSLVGGAAGLGDRDASSVGCSCADRCGMADRQIVRGVLRMGVESHNPRAARLLHTEIEGVRLGYAGIVQQADPGIAGHDIVDQFASVVCRATIEHDNLDLDVHRQCKGGDGVEAGADIALLVAARNEDGDQAFHTLARSDSGMEAIALQVSTITFAH